MMNHTAEMRNLARLPARNAKKSPLNYMSAEVVQCAEDQLSTPARRSSQSVGGINSLMRIIGVKNLRESVKSVDH